VLVLGPAVLLLLERESYAWTATRIARGVGGFVDIGEETRGGS
jgi:hypothetical protein